MDTALLARPTLAVDPVHDGRHKLGQLPIARESSPYLLNLPDLGIAGFVYFWVNGASEAGAVLALFGPGVGEPLTQRLVDRPIPKDMDFTDWRIDGFTLRQDLAFRKADVAWRSPAADLELAFEGFHPPYAYGANAEGCPAYAASDRIEQSGQIKGHLRLGERTLEIDALGHRDHSWGTRDWGAFQHYHWFQGQTADGVSVHFWRFLALGRIHLRGYVFKDGLLAEVTDVDLDVTHNDELWQQKLVATITDEAGRVTEVRADFYAHYTLVPDPALTLREGAARATFDGRPGTGWLEVAWPPAYLAHIAANGPY
jgi:hypothetical protein